MQRAAALLTALMACGAQAAGLPTDAEIHRILQSRVEAIAVNNHLGNIISLSQPAE